MWGLQAYTADNGVVTQMRHENLRCGVYPTASFPLPSLASVVIRFTLVIDGCLIHASALFSVIQCA